MQLLRCHQWKTGAQIVTCLMAKRAQRAGARTICFRRSVIQNVLQKVKVLAHE
jgi:hypothetical protein